MLDIRGLRKVYEDGTVGVDGLDLQIAPGEIYVLLGANGAGKTSTIMMILGFTEPTAGTVSVKGVDVQKNPLEAKQHAVYVSENVMLYGNFTAHQNLQFFSRLGGRTDLTLEDYLDVIRRVGMSENALRRRVHGFSKGMRQRLGIAIAILKNCGLIVMDEPTSGLDPKGAYDFLEIVRQLRKEGRAILMSSHDIFRAKMLADRIGIMRAGKIVETLNREQIESGDLERIYLETMKSEVAGSTSADVT